MPWHPLPQRPNARRRLQPSRFVQKCLSLIAPTKPLDVLDLPVGTGRHAEWLAGLGHRLTIADIDPTLVRSVEARLQAAGATCNGMVFDASRELPLERADFDLIVITDFVDEYLLANVGELLRQGGHLIYESYPVRGGNGQHLLPVGRTEELLGSVFDLKRLECGSIEPTGYGNEVVQLLVRRH